jgi:hypothetical protein
LLEDLDNSVCHLPPFGADVKETTLLGTASNNHEESVRLLMENGDDVKAKD